MLVLADVKWRRRSFVFYPENITSALGHVRHYDVTVGVTEIIDFYTVHCNSSIQIFSKFLHYIFSTYNVITISYDLVNVGGTLSRVNNVYIDYESVFSTVKAGSYDYRVGVVNYSPRRITKWNKTHIIVLLGQWFRKILVSHLPVCIYSLKHYFTRFTFLVPSQKLTRLEIHVKRR